jgi:hypothetical protein
VCCSMNVVTSRETHFRLRSGFKEPSEIRLSTVIIIMIELFELVGKWEKKIILK